MIDPLRATPFNLEATLKAATLLLLVCIEWIIITILMIDPLRATPFNLILI